MTAKNLITILVPQITRCLIFSVILSPRIVFAVTIPALNQQLYTKVSVTFDKPAFTVSYGQTVTLCATVTPSRMQSKIAFTSTPTGVFTINSGTVEGCNGVSLTVKSSVAKCVSQGTITAKLNSKTVNTSIGTILIPTSDFAVLMTSGYCFPIGCFRKEYNVYMMGAAGMDLTGLSANEHVTNLRQVDARPLCGFGLQTSEATPIPLDQGSNGYFGVADVMQIPGYSIPESCADKYDQVVSVGACTVQTNVFTFEADVSGARRISRSDEQ